MSPGMLKMWISIAGMGLMFLAIFTIYLSRYKLKGVLKILRPKKNPTPTIYFVEEGL